MLEAAPFLDWAQAHGHAPIPRVSGTSRAEFRAEYEANQRPVILEGMIEDWPARQKWSPDYLKEVFGDVTCHATLDLPDEGPLGDHKWADFTRWMPLAAFVDHMRAATKPCYMQQLPERLFEDIVKYFDFERLTEFGNFPVYINIFLGSHNTNSSLHYDMPNNFLAQIHGVKQLFMFAPEQHKHIAVYPDCLRVSPIDPYAPDLARWPGFKDARGVVGVLNPGDVAYIPKVWWHQLRSLGESISVNCWYGQDAPASYLLKVAAAGGASHVLRPAVDFVKFGVLRRPYDNRLLADVPTGKWLYDVFSKGLRRRVGAWPRSQKTPTA